MKPSKENLVMNGIVQGWLTQKDNDEKNKSTFASSWKAFNGADVKLPTINIKEGLADALSVLKCVFGAFNCTFKDGHSSACLLWVATPYVYALEMKDEGALPLRRLDNESGEIVALDNDDDASSVLAMLLAVENGGGGSGGDMENMVTTDTKQSISGEKTFTNDNGIGTDAIHNTDGNAMVRYKKTEGKLVYGSSAFPAVLMGSGDRPYYSKDGADFNGEEVALMSDLGNAGTSVYIVRH